MQNILDILNLDYYTPEVIHTQMYVINFVSVYYTAIFYMFCFILTGATTLYWAHRSNKYKKEYKIRNKNIGVYIQHPNTEFDDPISNTSAEYFILCYIILNTLNNGSRLLFKCLRRRNTIEPFEPYYI